MYIARTISGTVLSFLQNESAEPTFRDLMSKHSAVSQQLQVDPKLHQVVFHDPHGKTMKQDEVILVHHCLIKGYQSCIAESIWDPKSSILLFVCYFFFIII